MMVNEGGCPYNLPGIGDISYVKNLITEEISKDYSCSVFGIYTHPSAKIGWVRELNNFNWLWYEIELSTHKVLVCMEVDPCN